MPSTQLVACEARASISIDYDLDGLIFSHHGALFLKSAIVTMLMALNAVSMSWPQWLLYLPTKLSFDSLLPHGRNNT